MTDFAHLRPVFVSFLDALLQHHLVLVWFKISFVIKLVSSISPGSAIKITQCLSVSDFVKKNVYSISVDLGTTVTAPVPHLHDVRHPPHVLHCSAVVSAPPVLSTLLSNTTLPPVLQRFVPVERRTPVYPCGSVF